MKILSIDQIRAADTYTIANEPISDVDLMERAATACYYWLIENISHDRKIKVFCGSGNNGGDGLAISRLLIAKGYQVEVFLTGQPEQLSDSCRINYERYIEIDEARLILLKEKDPLPIINKEQDVVIDALFGSGLSREISGFPAMLVEHINHSEAVTISIDVPSGLFCDSTTAAAQNPVVIHADYTLTFAPPKLAFFFPENDKFIGRWHLLDIGIMQEYIDNADTSNFFIEKDDCLKILKRRQKFSHKGNYGHALLISGSSGKMGAAVLSARACLRSGPGLVTVHVPESGNTILQSAVPEAMLHLDPNDSIISGLTDLSPYSSIAVGPGIGTLDQTQKALKLLIQNSAIPLIFDADAINILGENKTWLSFVPKESVFTPHPKEFERLAGKSLNDFERNQKQREFSMKHGVYVVLKGAHTAISTPGGQCFFNSTGNPGMATGGSGDVLTGIIAGIKAQGYSSLTSCLLGVYIHGLAGDLAAEKLGYESLTASDIIDHLGISFISLYG